MLNPHNLRALLDENTSSLAPHYLIFTPHGTLLSFSSRLHTRRARDIAATAGGTWRILSNQHEWSGGGGLLMKVLDVRRKGGRIREMVVETEGGLVAICWCKEGVLVGVVGDAERDGRDDGDGNGGEGDEVTITSAGHASVADDESKEGVYGSEEDGVSRQQVLVWKAEGMAEALREDLRDFVIPVGFY